MDGERFDELTRRISTTRLTRLSVLRGAAAGAMALVTGAKVGASRMARAQDVTGTCRNFGHPCEGQQDCCAGIEVCQIVGPGNARRCANNPDCGAITQPCCDGQCQAGLECRDNICVDPNTECGGVGQPCCAPNNTCDPGGVCSGGTCVPCGAATERCCPGDTCDTPDLTCASGGGTAGTCVPCGVIGQPCCEGQFCVEDAVCDATQGPDGTCVACGALNEPCCAGPEDGCDGTLICNNNHICVPPTPGCGTLGQVCCAGNVCTQGQCINGTCQNPTPGPAPVTRCTSSAQCPTAAPFCNTTTGQCISIGSLRCKSGETAQQCCNRSVKKGCKRKQQTAHAHKNCIRKGKKRCKGLLAGIV